MTVDPLRAKSLFLAASDLPHAELRAAYLDRECCGDAKLRFRVEALLRANDAVPLQPFQTAEETSTQFAAKRAEPEDVGDPTISAGSVLGGKYKLIQEIGAGGMGSVYMAQQTEPVKRPVAVKVIKAGMDSKAVLARFEAERQALAMMDHPNIARVLDAGTTPSGRPFFVMELVKGQPITQFCDERKLTPRQRLELFVPVCLAIQHAHQKGVIHRDIKPSNVIVAMYDDHPVPKVIDFGLAKAAGQTLTDKTLMTGFGAVVGTPEYMSPEQASLNNLDIDTRSDIYSLGVLLYELLTGATPVDRKSLGKAAVMEILRIVREVDAPRLSVKLSSMETLPSVAANRSTEPAKLSKLMKGELDWIVLKALNKERSRRYETANGIAADIQRHLGNEPVVARPPSAAYRLQKTWQRNKFVIGAASAIAVSLILGIAASVIQTMRANREAQRAIAALNELQKTAPAFFEQARALAAKEQFTEAIEKLDYATKLRPDIVDYLIAKGNLLQCQFRFEESAKAYRKALESQPNETQAKENLELCDELLSSPRAADGKLTRESLSKLHVAMQKQQRPAAELMPVSRLLGEEKNLVVAYWLERLKDLPISADRPLSQRITVRDDGLLKLDLRGTKVSDLTPLAGAPIAVLDLWGISDLKSIEPLRGMKLNRLLIGMTSVEDISPLEKMQSLEELWMGSTQITNLTPLQGIKLKRLDMTSCPVSDIAPLSNASLEHLVITGTRITDLSPLTGMPLKHLNMGLVPVTDFTPLAGLPLEVINFPGCQLTDLAFLKGLPLKELMLWNCHSVRNYAVLSEIKTLELLILPDNYRKLPDDELAAIESLRNHPKLRQLGSEGKIDHTTTSSKNVFWKEWDEKKTYFSGLSKSGFKYSSLKLPNGTYQINLEQQSFSDLSILKGIPISRLWLNGCRVSDLNPIRDLPLEILGLSGNPVADLSPIGRMKLEELAIEGTEVTDLNPLRSIPLKTLYFHDTEIADISPLLDIRTLEKVTVPFRSQNVIELKKLPNLKMIAFTRSGQNPWFPASDSEQFWQYEQLDWIRSIRELSQKWTRINPLSDGTFEVNLDKVISSDISFLRGANISVLSIGDSQVADLSPLSGMPLKTLCIFKTEVVDLSPLKGLPLNHLNAVATKITDVSALRDLPLAILYLNQCEQLSDITPLKDIKTLKELTLPPSPKDLASLRELTNLERLSFWQDSKNEMRSSKTTAEFWKRIDRLKAIGSDSTAGKPSIPNEVMTFDEVRNHIGERVVVKLEVLSTGQSRDNGWVYLNSKANYRDPENDSIAIHCPKSESLQELGLPGMAEFHDKMIGRKIIAAGIAALRQGIPQVKIEEDDMIWMVEKQ